jgi:hypothetical protein
MNFKKRTTIFGAVFWILFLVSIGLATRYPWLDVVWMVAAIAFGIITSVFSIMEMFRNRASSGEYVYYRGAPRWVRWLLQDEDEYARDLERRTRLRLPDR